MSFFRIVTSGYDGVLKSLKTDVRGNIKRVLQKHGRIMETTAKKIITVKAFKTGYLRSQTYHKVIGCEELIIGNGAEYASYVFLGTYRMPARPCLMEAINMDRAELLADLENTIGE